MKNIFAPKKTRKMRLGDRGEELACKYLKKKGYRILERNFRKPWGEIDIIAIASDKTLVFVEVKTMLVSNAVGLRPEDQLTTSKLCRIQRTASLYAGSHGNLIKDKRGWRIDLVAIEVRDGGEEYRHYENISF